MTRPSHPDRRAALEKEPSMRSSMRGSRAGGRRRSTRGSATCRSKGNSGETDRDRLSPIVFAHVRFPALPADVPTVDFSGWPMVVRADMPEESRLCSLRGD